MTHFVSTLTRGLPRAAAYRDRVARSQAPASGRPDPSGAGRSSVTLLVLCSALAVCLPARAAAYRTLADLEGSPSPITWSNTPRVTVDSGSFPPGLAELVAVELEPSVSTWNEVPCSDRLLMVDHVTPNVSVRFESQWTESGFDFDAAATTELVLQSAPDGGTRITGAVIHLNGGMRWVQYGDAREPDARDLRIVLVHELGHVLGLAHICELDDPALACAPDHQGIVMHPLYGMGGGSMLATDDVEGVCSLYPHPIEPLECSTSTDCFDGEVCIDGACRTDELFGASCRQRSDCRTTYCIADPFSPAGGICTRDCELSADCPSGSQCVPVEGLPLRVCKPRGAHASCAAAPGRASPALAPLLLMFFAAVRPLRRLARGTPQ